MRRAFVFGALTTLTAAMVNVDAEARWIDRHLAVLGLLAAVGVCIFFAVGAFAITALAPTSRSREVSPRCSPAPTAEDSLPSSGSRVHRSATRTRTSATARHGTRPYSPPSLTGGWDIPRKGNR